MTTRATLLAVLCALVAAPGCGDDDGPPSSSQPTETVTTAEPAPSETLASQDKRGEALACIRDEKGIEAEPVGAKEIQIGAPGEDPRIEFFQSSLEAEGEQFEGRAEGAEQIGAAHLYVREAPESLLEDLEDCLNDQ
ncbi:MAG: hypothetical protein WD993_10750 [Thermoleophilaceae bacterium]